MSMILFLCTAVPSTPGSLNIYAALSAWRHREESRRRVTYITRIAEI